MICSNSPVPRSYSDFGASKGAHFFSRGLNMSKGVLRAGVAIIFLAAFAWAQAGPKLTSVDPAAGKAGDNLTISGENLGKDSVEAVMLSDEDKDYPAEVVSQSAEKIVMKVPKVKAGGYNVSIKIGNNIYIQPVRFTVQE